MKYIYYDSEEARDYLELLAEARATVPSCRGKKHYPTRWAIKLHAGYYIDMPAWRRWMDTHYLMFALRDINAC